MPTDVVVEVLLEAGELPLGVGTGEVVEAVDVEGGFDERGQED